MKRYLTDNEVTGLKNAYVNADGYEKYKWCFVNSIKKENGSWIDCGHDYLGITRYNKRFFLKKVKNNYYAYNEEQNERWLLTNEAKKFLNISE